MDEIIKKEEEEVQLFPLLFGHKDIRKGIQVLGKKVEFWILSQKDIEEIYTESTNYAQDLFLRDMLVKKMVISRSISSIDGKPFGGKFNTELKGDIGGDNSFIYEVYRKRMEILSREVADVLDLLYTKYSELYDFYKFLVLAKLEVLKEVEPPPFLDVGNLLNSSQLEKENG